MPHSDAYHIKHVHYDRDSAVLCHGVDEPFDRVIESYGFNVLNVQECEDGWNVQVKVSKHSLFHNIVNRIPYLTVLPDNFRFDSAV